MFLRLRLRFYKTWLGFLLWCFYERENGPDGIVGWDGTDEWDGDRGVGGGIRGILTN